MASRIIHYAICNEIKDNIKVNDINRFIIGSLLPDSGENHANTHYKINSDDGKKKLIDFHSFYDSYKDKILSDELYLGYYFHLIQDAIYRKVIYIDNGFLEKHSAKFVEELYNDYSLINSYLSKKYSAPVCEPELNCDDINKICNFNQNKLIADLLQDFSDSSEGDPKYLTYLILNEYINQAVNTCIEEYKSIKSGKSHLNPMDYSWRRI